MHENPEGEATKNESERPKRRSTLAFWVILFAPATMGLLSITLGSSNAKSAGEGIALLALPLAIVSSIYCSIWIVRRYSSPEALHILRVLILMFALAAVNLAIVFTGCAVSFDAIDFR